MSSLIAVNTGEGESILQEVEELSEFHPDQLSSLVDIQEELDKLEACETVNVEGVSLSAVDDVNVVDHEVTIVAEQANEGMAILPEISEITLSSSKEKMLGVKPYNAVIIESLDIEQAIRIDSPNIFESGTVNHIKNVNLIDADKCRVTPVKPAETCLGQPPVNISQLKEIRPLPEALKGKQPFIVSQQKKTVLTKVIFTPDKQTAPDAPIIFGEPGSQTIRIVGQKKPFLNNTPKTITLSQAREMGLLSPGKMQPFIPNQPKSTIKKGLMMNSNKIVSVKSSPTKILPLPTTAQLQPIAPSPTVNTLTASQHKIIIHQSSSAIKSGTFSGPIITSSSSSAQGQILQIPVSQDNSNNQVHQVQLPGKQVQFVRLMSSATATVSNVEPVDTKTEPVVASSVTVRPVPVALTTNVSTTSQLKMVPIAPVQTLSSPALPDANSFERVLVSPGLSQLAARTDDKLPTSNIVMVPAEYVKQYKPIPDTQSPPLSPKPVISSAMALPAPVLTKAKEVLNYKDTVTTQVTQKSKATTDPPNGIRPRKPCNCTKSQCLKLYCDCFANGEFCFQCNCNSCFNNLDHEEERQRAIKACLERNPNAFRPKIGKGYIGDERRHNKGCNCKRSGCLKNYCECYEAKIPCSNNCKCVGCRNVEETKDICDSSIIEENKISKQTVVKNKLSSEIQESAYKPHSLLTSQGTRQPFNLMSQEVVEATCQCLLAQVDGDGQLTEHVERLILEEFGRCLVEIIDCATRTVVNNLT